MHVSEDKFSHHSAEYCKNVPSNSVTYLELNVTKIFSNINCQRVVDLLTVQNKSVIGCCANGNTKGIRRAVVVSTVRHPTAFARLNNPEGQPMF